MSIESLLLLAARRSLLVIALCNGYMDIAHAESWHINALIVLFAKNLRHIGRSKHRRVQPSLLSVPKFLSGFSFAATFASIDSTGTDAQMFVQTIFLSATLRAHSSIFYLFLSSVCKLHSVSDETQIGSGVREWRWQSLHANTPGSWIYCVDWMNSIFGYTCLPLPPASSLPLSISFSRHILVFHRLKWNYRVRMRWQPKIWILFIERNVKSIARINFVHFSIRSSHSLPLACIRRDPHSIHVIVRTK